MPLIAKLNDCCRDFDGNLDSITEICRESLATERTQAITQVWFLLGVYVRENSLGPSIHTEYVEETRAPLVKSGVLPKNKLDPMTYKNECLQRNLLKYFERDGE